MNNQSLTTEQLAEIARANALQVRRERWAAALEALPQPKCELEAFPYASFDELLDDAGRKLGGDVAIMKLLEKAWKTKQWRKQAEINRANRDAAAERDAAKNVQDGVKQAIEELASGKA